MHSTHRMSEGTLKKDDAQQTEELIVAIRERKQKRVQALLEKRNNTGRDSLLPRAEGMVDTGAGKGVVVRWYVDC